ncbi:hypothetical protein OESDEN_11920 [Oesophagostomum dentatum]|uniref:Uncharacterized protein n=1 Tax=Oesophagostomum dentatum TaxID=61180 RepID=A0A0B1SSK4_OESDE|nr:hypothetical protein OESDEN_11920 [Oesophagostomum dentatum]
MCTAPCFILDRCVLVATNCCPTSACRALAPTTFPPIFTIPAGSRAAKRGATTDVPN